jgi:hypothetical protein
VTAKGCKSFDAAMKFIPFATQLRPRTEFGTYLCCGEGFLFNGEWLVSYLTKITERFKEWRLSQGDRGAEGS